MKKINLHSLAAVVDVKANDMANDNREKKINCDRFMFFVKHQHFTQDVTQ